MANSKDIVKLLKSDAENWGNNLNESAWTFLEVLPPEAKNAEIFNNLKIALRISILKYIELSEKSLDPSLDPCPGCQPGGVCRTIACGRLKLPVDHPLRKGVL